MPFIKKAKNTHFIESVLKKSGIINKHAAAIESVMQNMSEITEKARQAQCLNNEKTQAYIEETRRQQIMAIFSSNYSFNIDDLEIQEGDEVGDGNEMMISAANSSPYIEAMVDEDGEENLLDIESRLQNQSNQTAKMDRMSIMTSNSIISQNQQQTLLQSNNQFVYTNPNSRSIPNSKSQVSSLKYISSHSLVRPGQQGQVSNSSHSSQQIRQSKAAISQSNSTVMGKGGEDSRSKSISNSLNKNENESKGKIVKGNSKHSSISVISNNNQNSSSKQNSQKLLGSEIFELSKDTSMSKESNVSRNNSNKPLIKEEDEEEIIPLNKEDVIKHQISQPNMLGKNIYIIYYKYIYIKLLLNNNRRG